VSLYKGYRLELKVEDKYMGVASWRFAPKVIKRMTYKLRAPDWRIVENNKDKHFFFTSNGWKKIGRQLYRKAKQHNYPVRVLKIMTDEHVKIDKYQFMHKLSYKCLIEITN